MPAILSYFCSQVDVKNYTMTFVSLLDEDVLLTAPRPKGVRLPKKSKVRNLRYLWRRVVAHRLGWCQRQKEGDEGSVIAM